MSAAVVLCLVLALHDGDSLSVRCADRAKPVAIRLVGVDAPEVAGCVFGRCSSMQPYAIESRDNLRRLCPVGTNATIHRKNTDRYGRTVAAVECGGKFASEEQVAAGLAWSLTPPKRSAIPALEAQARAAKRGLWGADVPPVKPSQWRRGVTS